MIQEIDFNPELFNDLYWELEADLNNHDLRFIWLYGGSSASKTYTYCQAEIVRKLTYRDDNAMVIRKYGVDIKDSIYADFVGIISDWGLSDYFKIQINYIECLLTGSYIRFRGLDDSEKIKGLARFKRVVYEEISQGDATDLKQIRKRLRGKVGQQIVGLFNPISEEHWIKTKVFDTLPLLPVPTQKNITSIEQSSNTKVYRVTYLNNYFIVGKWVDRFVNNVCMTDGFNPDPSWKQIGGFVDKHTIEDFERDKLTDYGNYEVYALGMWGSVRTGGEFYRNFKKEDHVRPTKYDPALPLHISFDDNSVPYLPVGIFQLIGKELKMIDEIAGVNPDNTVEKVCAEFSRRYQAHQSGLFLYGDATARKQDTKLEKGHNFYTIIIAALSKFRPIERTTKSNPSVAMRGNFINQIFGYNYNGISITIGENCAKTITDLSKVKENPDGTKLKEAKKDKVTGVTAQEFGHFSDLLDYMICTAFANDYELYKGKKTDNASNWVGGFA